jgi:hypothetical protein
MKKEVLEKRRRILSEEHPDTITAISNLVNTLGDQGHLDEAISLLEETVQKMRRIHGDQHPHTKVAVNNLARYSAARSGKAGGLRASTSTWCPLETSAC